LGIYGFDGVVTAVAVGLLGASAELAGGADGRAAGAGLAAGGCEGPTTTIGAMPSNVCFGLGAGAEAATAAGPLGTTGAVGALGCTAGSGTVWPKAAAAGFAKGAAGGTATGGGAGKRAGAGGAATGSGSSQEAVKRSESRSASASLSGALEGRSGSGIYALGLAVRLASALVARQRSQLKRFMLWAAAWGGVALGCAQGSSPAPPSPATSDSAAVSEALAARPLAMASAAALAVQASRAPGPEGNAALQQAASIRVRLFRREHHEADALEALDLWRQVERRGGALRCVAGLSRVLLEGELNVDPDATYRALYTMAHDASGDCRTRIDSALALLEAFRPSDSALAELDQQRAVPSASSAPPATSLQAPSGAAATATLTRIERYSAKDAARVVVFVSNPVRFEVGALEASSGNGPRLFVDLRGAHYAGKGTLAAEGLLERVRASEGTDGTRVVLDLSAAAEHRVFYVPEPFRLVIDVAKRDASLRATRDVRRVVLDPGHGGYDPGAIGPTGLREKDVALDIAHRAAPLVARELGISTLLTRDADVFVPLEERTARANAFGADLFISIHCNATERSGSSGVMTFVLDDSRDQLASRIAALENSASAEATSELARVMSRSGDRVSDARSYEFAGLLQRAAMASLSPSYPDVPDGGVKRAGFYVLAGARMPAVLFETSFISSARDETRFNTGDFRQKLADAIVNAIRAYKEGRGAPK
jgi:N-acetylmuramoyl-L-alanine amidase